MPFNPGKLPVKRHNAERRKDPHSKSVLSGGPMAAKLAKGRTGALLGIRHSHDAWNKATAPVQTMEGKLKPGQTGVNLDPKKKRRKKGRWSGFVYDLTKDRTKKGVGLVRMERPSDTELYGGRTQAFRRIMAHKRARNTLRPY